MSGPDKTSPQKRAEAAPAIGGQALPAAIPDATVPDLSARDADKKFLRLVDGIPTGIYRTTPDGRILLANAAILKMLGFNSFSELAERNLAAGSFTGYPRSEFTERLGKDGAIRGLESTWKKKDGTDVSVRENARAVMDGEGNVVYFEGTADDITDVMKTHEEIAAKAVFLEEVITNAAVGIIVIDEDNKYVLLNPESGRIVGHWPDDWTGRGAGMHIHPEDSGRAMAHFIQAISGEPNEFEIRIEAVDGSWKHVRVLISPLEIMGKPHVLGIVTDISKKKQLEEELLNKRSYGLTAILLILSSILERKLPPGAIDGIIPEFEKVFERAFREKLEDDIETLAAHHNKGAGARTPEDTLGVFLLLFSELLKRNNIRTEWSVVGSTGYLEMFNCPMSEYTAKNPAACRGCASVLFRCFEWAGLRGKASKRPVVSSPNCVFEFELSPQAEEAGGHKTP